MNRAELGALLKKVAPPEDTATFPKLALDTIDEWIERGDGCAIYRNEDLGHSELGHIKFVSFGGPKSQLEVPDPPKTLPDIGGEINWRYQLWDTYTGERDDHSR
jgi:hypothetical protein